MNNVGHDPRDVYHVNTIPDVTAYDSLPKPLRVAIANAEYQYSAESLLDQWVEFVSEFKTRANPEELAVIYAKALTDSYKKERQAKQPMAIAMAPYKSIGYGNKATPTYFRKHKKMEF